MNYPCQTVPRWHRFVAGVCLLLLLASLAACQRSSEPDSEGNGESATPVAAMTLAERDLSRRVRVGAPAEARQTIRRASRSEGTLLAVHVEQGDTVEAGGIRLLGSSTSPD